MASITVHPGTRTALTTTALDALTAGAYVSAGVVNASAIDPLDVVVEVAATPGTVAGNKQLLVFARVSFDGSTFSTGPTSGSVTTDEANLRFLGALPLASNATLQRGAFSVMSALGFVPPWLEVVLKNDSGAALAGSGHAVHFTAYTGVSA